ncbi:hypothetical protein ACFWVC_26945 [Streptomyces sp. NPDC058691]|uniref:hypothetical protein n=1 Tax=Streptomyces sp. NPDC058691 TaxID=3346601 RepID=UPI00365CD802
MSTIRAIRLDVDGRITDLEVTAADVRLALRPVVDGFVEIAHYGRADGSCRLSVAVNEEGFALGKQPNVFATSLVAAVRLQQLRRPLVGDVVLLGGLNHALQHTDVPDPVREVLPKIVEALKARYAAATS